MAKKNQYNNLQFNSKDFENISKLLSSYNSTINRQIAQSDISNFAKELSESLTRQNQIRSSIGEELRGSLENGSFLKNINAINGLSRITPPNFPDENFAKQIANFTLGSQILVNNLNTLSKNIASDIANFSPLKIGIQDINESLYKEINQYNDWSNLESITDINEEFVEEIEDTEAEEISDIIELRDTLIERLLVLYERARTEIGKEYIWRLMNLISLILSIYSAANPSQKTVIHTKEIVRESKNSLPRIESKLDSLNKKLDSKNQLRIAIANVNLRLKNKKGSKKSGLVQSGQIVIVLKIKHKWLYISYVNSNTGEVHFGYVFKKYFDTI